MARTCPALRAPLALPTTATDRMLTEPDTAAAAQITLELHGGWEAMRKLAQEELLRRAWSS